MIQVLLDPSSVLIIGITSFFMCIYLLVRAFKFKCALRFALGFCFAFSFIISSYYALSSFSESNFYVADAAVSQNAP